MTRMFNFFKISSHKSEEEYMDDRQSLNEFDKITINKLDDQVSWNNIWGRRIENANSIERLTQFHMTRHELIPSLTKPKVNLSKRERRNMVTLYLNSM